MENIIEMLYWNYMLFEGRSICNTSEHNTNDVHLNVIRSAVNTNRLIRQSNGR